MNFPGILTYFELFEKLQEFFEHVFLDFRQNLLQGVAGNMVSSPRLACLVLVPLCDMSTPDIDTSAEWFA